MSLFLKISGAMVAVGIATVVVVRTVRAIPVWKANRSTNKELQATKEHACFMASMVMVHSDSVYADAPVMQKTMHDAFTDLITAINTCNSVDQIRQLERVTAYLSIVNENLRNGVLMTRELIDSHIVGLKKGTVVHVPFRQRLRQAVRQGWSKLCWNVTVVLAAVVLALVILYQGISLFTFGVRCVKVKRTLRRMSKKNVYGADMALHEVEIAADVITNREAGRSFGIEDLFAVSDHRRHLRLLRKRLRRCTSVSYADILYMRRLKEFLVGTPEPVLLLATS